MNISYDWYNIFYHTALNKNISRAAESLCISQPAVSQTIKQLESALGCELFLRTKKGVTLTGEGEVFFRYISKAMEQIALAEKSLESRLNLESGEILIGASDMTLEFFLLPHLEKFHRLYPGIKIGVTNGSSPTTIKALEDEQIDFCAVSGPIETSSEFPAYKVRELEDIFIAGSKFAYMKDKTLTKAALASLPLIMLDKNTSTRKYIDNYFAEGGIEIKPEFELSTSRLIVQFTQRNLGIGCVMKDFAIREIENGNIFEIRLADEIIKRDISIVRKKGTISKAASKLLDIIL